MKKRRKGREKREKEKEKGDEAPNAARQNRVITSTLALPRKHTLKARQHFDKCSYKRHSRHAKCA
ncbi:hypothetical protein ACC713_37580, partial [Rhizobium johnstonii]|uniref:hypothetical protein n=1 Tax=Rhizobium johnstonii TaxID=3019933 RepID=UPI003F960B7D